MTIIEVIPQSNGAHRNQTSTGPIEPPEGWAVVPETMQPLENFPFGGVEVKEIDGALTVTKWTPGTVPEPEPEPEPPEPEEPTEALLLDLAADHEERICLLEMGVN